MNSFLVTMSAIISVLTLIAFLACVLPWLTPPEDRTTRENARRTAVFLTTPFCCILSFMLSCLLIGGSADGGKISDGHYFVVDHGRYTEVPPILFWLSNYLYYVFLCGFAAFIIGVFADLLWPPFDSSIYSPRPWKHAGTAALLYSLSPLWVAALFCWLNR